MNQGTDEVIGKLLALISSWRERLGRNIALRNPTTCGKDLDIIVHGIVSRILFLRLCEERGILEPGTLRGLLEGEGVYRRLLDYFPGSDARLDSGITGSFAPILTVDRQILGEITEQL
ncbi:MAG: restriction endonuclease subunit M, partial [Methanomicrobiales archaeon]|nr:restriction endonuclease subunit M [Methanomicrobiales archaeon]